MSERCVIHGDCLEALAGLPGGSVDAIVTDPPYGIGFMGHEWDQPGDHGPLKKNGTPGPPNVHHGRGRRFRASQPEPSGYELEGGGAMAAGRYDLSYAANRRFQAWVQSWAEECFRVLKPGGYLISFGGTRTYHRLASGVEDAGFEVRDCLQWLFGSGFPKSLDVAKAIDKAERGVSQGGADPTSPNHGRYKTQATEGKRGDGDEGRGFGAGPGQFMAEEGVDDERELSPTAAEWDGWGTALKPAFEPIVMARKPLEAGTVAANVLRYGTGAINVDACRVAWDGESLANDTKRRQSPGQDFTGGRFHTAGGEDGGYEKASESPEGRWPSNVLLSHHEDCVEVGTKRVRSDSPMQERVGSGSGAARSKGVFGDGMGGKITSAYADEEGMETVEAWDCVEGCPVRMLDEQTGTLVSGKPGMHRLGVNTSAAFGTESRTPGTPMSGYGDAGGASRFFYCAKVSRAERNAGLDDMPDRDGKVTSTPTSTMQNGRSGSERVDEREYVPKPRKNHHPTVKPIDVMRWLIRLTVRPGGVLVDPFAGSGSTLCAAALEGVNAIGIEREADYVSIMVARVYFWEEHGHDGLRIVREREQAAARRVKAAEQGQLELL